MIDRSEAEKLIERLRKTALYYGHGEQSSLGDEAADAIAAQEAELATKEEQRRFADDAARQSFEKLSASLAETERLRTALDLAQDRLKALDGYQYAVPEGHNADIIEYIAEALAIPTDVSGAGQ